MTPWLAARLLARHVVHARRHASEDAVSRTRWLHRLFARVLGPFLDQARAPRAIAACCSAAMLLLVLLSAGLAALRVVVLKMLPFDNKSEMQIVVDMPEGSTLETTNALLMDVAQRVAQVPEVVDFQGYAGTSAPVNFNGLVRQYYLRTGNNVGDLQVNLVDKHQRKRQSHEIARALRPDLAAIAARYGASLKVVEVPPGPPVLAPLVAEIYGPDYARSRRTGPRAGAGVHRTRPASSMSTRRWRPTRRTSRWWWIARAPRGWACRRRTSSIRSPPRWQARMPPGCRTAARATRIRCACGCRPPTRPACRSCWRCACAPRSGKLVPLSELVTRAARRLGRRDPSQGSAAGGVRDRR